MRKENMINASSLNLNWDDIMKSLFDREMSNKSQING